MATPQGRVVTRGTRCDDRHARPATQLGASSEPASGALAQPRARARHPGPSCPAAGRPDRGIVMDAGLRAGTAAVLVSEAPAPVTAHVSTLRGPPWPADPPSFDAARSLSPGSPPHRAPAA